MGATPFKDKAKGDGFMKITILNGNPNADNVKFDNYLKELSDLLDSNNHTVTILKLREMDIKYCTGCFGCWVKTPGECVVADDMRDIRREYIHSDFVLFTSPVIMKAKGSQNFNSGFLNYLGRITGIQC
jgi:multimeric flavodoxin WrbA